MKYKIRPSSAQVRAARSLLNIKQKALAEACGVTGATISSIEVEKTQISLNLSRKITDFFWDQGIEFTQDDGLKRRSEAIEVLEGEAGFHQFLDNVYLDAQATQEPFDIMVCGVEDQKFVEAAGEKTQPHLDRMASLKNIRVKSINIEDDPTRVSEKYCEYRSMDKESLGTVPFYIYGANMAIILWGKNIQVIVLKNKSLAEAYKKQFNSLWKNARPLKYG